MVGAVIATSGWCLFFAVFLPVALFFPAATGTIYQQFRRHDHLSRAISTFNRPHLPDALRPCALRVKAEPPAAHLCTSRAPRSASCYGRAG